MSTLLFVDREVILLLYPYQPELLLSRSTIMPRRRRRSRSKQQSKVGLSPGSLVYTGFAEPSDHPITVVSYTADEIVESTFNDAASACRHVLNEPGQKHWMRLVGLHQTDRIQTIGDSFGVDPLVLEDIANTSSRPKHEHFTGYDFITCKLLISPSDKEDPDYPIFFSVEQLSMILFDNVLITFHETQRVTFKTITNRIRLDTGRHRQYGVDYLAYSIIDTTVDHYMYSLEMMADQIQETEILLLDQYDQSLRRLIHDTSMEVIKLRKHIAPFREALWSIYRSEDGRLTNDVKPYMRDVYDHMNSIMETLEFTRDMVVRLSETYMSTLTLRMNEIIKLLTIISTIFIPLTFIVGVYGMNFDPSVSKWNMPEIQWPYGYLFAWGLMIAIALGMIGYIKRRKWM